MPPVSGATLPIAIVRVAGTCAFLSSPQPATPTMAAIAIRPKWERIMAASGSRRSAKGRLIMRTAHGAVNFPRRFTRRGRSGRRLLAARRQRRLSDGFRLFDRQNVFRQSLGIVIADGPVRRHRDGAPHAGRTFLDLLHEIRLGVLSGLVLV